MLSTLISGLTEERLSTLRKSMEKVDLAKVPPPVEKSKWGTFDLVSEPALISRLLVSPSCAVLAASPSRGGDVAVYV